MRKRSAALVLAVLLTLTGISSISVYADDGSQDPVSSEAVVTTEDGAAEEMPADEDAVVADEEEIVAEESEEEPVEATAVEESADESAAQELSEQEAPAVRDQKEEPVAEAAAGEGEEEPAKEGWNESGDMYYTDKAANDSYYTSADGLVQIGDSKHLFDGSGKLVKGPKSVTVSGKKYYVNAQGAVITKPGWIFVSGKKTYYARKDGSLYVNQKVKIDDYNRYFDDEGKLVVGPAIISYDGAKHYVNENGVVRTAKGVVTVGNKKYYLEPGGTVATSKWILKNGKKLYYAKSSGVLYVDKKVKLGRYSRIFGSDGKLVTGPTVVKHNGKKYYVNENGVVRTTAGIVTFENSKGKTVKYYVKKNGTVRTVRGILTWKEKGGKTHKYYVKKGGQIRTVSGFVTYKDNKYYVRSGGNGWLLTSTKKSIHGSKYIFAASGKVKKGIVKYKGDYYYCYVGTGKVCTRPGMYQTQDKKDHFYVKSSSGKLATSEVITVDGTKYVFKKNARRASGIVMVKGNYYLCSTKHHGAVRTEAGKFKYKGKWYYAKEGGVLYRNAFIVNEEVVYHASSKAYLNTSAFKSKTTSGKKITLHPNSSTARIPFDEYSDLFPYPAAPSATEPCVLVDISDQTLYYYENGRLKFKTPVVTGKIYGVKYHGTPTGLFHVQFKQTNTYLEGLEDDGKTKYKSYVNYWMPFTGNGYGLHDATWRDAFGGTIYQYSGSHGCVNLPYSYAQKLYAGIRPGSIVKIQQ